MPENEPKNENTNSQNERSEDIRALEKKWLEKNGFKRDGKASAPVAVANDNEHNDSQPE